MNWNIKMIKLKDMLTERLNNIVYHVTTIYNLDNILKKNIFILSPSLADDIKLTSEKFYFLSTARSLLSTYIINYDRSYSYCILILDGIKFNNNYKSRSCNFFYTLDYSRSHQCDNEFEDRILSNKSIIKNAKSYIKEIHIYFSNISKQYNGIKNIIKNSDNIPIYTYDNRNNFLRLTKDDKIKEFLSSDSINNNITSEDDINIENNYDEISQILINIYNNNITKDIEKEDIFRALSNIKSKKSIKFNILLFIKNTKNAIKNLSLYLSTHRIRFNQFVDTIYKNINNFKSSI